MYQYLNAFINRSGDSLPGYFARLYDSDGNQVDMFADDSGTPIATVSGVANAALSDNNGMFRWFVANGTYDMRFYDANDVFVSVETGVPMVNAASVVVDLSAETGATLVGTPTGTVQDDIDAANAGLAARPTSAALAAPTGGEMVGFQQDGDDAIESDILVKAKQVVADRDYSNGLVGALTAVRNNDDTSFSGAVSVPNGIIARASAMTMPQIHARVQGNGGGTYFMQASVAAFSWSGVASAAQSDFQGFRVYGGTHAFDLTPVGEVASLHFTDVTQTLGTGAMFNVSEGLTSCVFTRCGKLGGTYGIYSAGGINNHNVLDHCTFGELTDSAVRMENLTQGLVIRNARVEAGGTDGKVVFDLEGALAFRVEGGWYEAHHEYFLKLDASSHDGTVVDGVVDVGASHGGGAFKASLWDVGDNLIVYGTNFWSELTTAPKNILIYGLNDNLYAASSNVWEHKSQRGGKVHLRQRNTVIDTATFDILTLSRTSSVDALTNLQTLSGTLTLTYSGLNSASGLPASRTVKYPVSLSGIAASFIMVIGSAYGAIDGGNGTITLTPAEKAGGTALSKTIQVTVAGHFAGQCLVDASFDFDLNSNLSTNLIAVTAL